MKGSFSINQPNIRAKIIGTIFIVIGLILLFTDDALYIKLAFSLILIGILLIFIITEKTIPSKISKAQIEGNFNAFENIAKNLNLSGNAIFIPTSDILDEERIFIPLDKKDMNIPELNDDSLFSTGLDGKSLGMAIPPSGLKLLQEIEKETNFSEIAEDNIEEQLQSFVGMDLLKSVTLKRLKGNWKLQLEKPIFCQGYNSMCKQYPCPTCSAILTAITRSTDKKIWINDVVHNGKKVDFSLKIGD